MADKSSTSKYGTPTDNPTTAPPRTPPRVDVATFNTTAGGETSQSAGKNMRGGR